MLFDQQEVRNTACEAPRDRGLGRERPAAGDEHAVGSEPVEGPPDQPVDGILAAQGAIHPREIGAARKPVHVPWRSHRLPRGRRLRCRVEDAELDVAGFGESVEERRRLGRGLREDAEEPYGTVEALACPPLRDAHVDLCLRAARPLPRPEGRAPVAHRPAVRGEPMRCVVEGVDVAPAPRELLVVARLRAAVRLFEATSDMRVVVRLMDRDDASRRVDHGTRRVARTPHQPVVEAGAADQERGHGIEQSAREDEVVEGRIAA